MVTVMSGVKSEMNSSWLLTVTFKLFLSLKKKVKDSGCVWMEDFWKKGSWAARFKSGPVRGSFPVSVTPPSMACHIKGHFLYSQGIGARPLIGSYLLERALFFLFFFTQYFYLPADQHLLHGCDVIQTGDVRGVGSREITSLWRKSLALQFFKAYL